VNGERRSGPTNGRDRATPTSRHNARRGQLQAGRARPPTRPPPTMDLLSRMKSINPRRTSATAAAAAASGEPRPLPAMPLSQTASTASNDSGGPDANAPHTPDKDDAMSEDDMVLLVRYWLRPPWRAAVRTLTLPHS